MSDQITPTEPHTVVSQATVDEVRDVVDSPAVQHLAAEIPVLVKETRAGYKTTEFWLTIVGLLAVNLNGVVLTLPDKYQAIATAVLGLGYTISRGQAKAGVASVEPVVPEA